MKSVHDGKINNECNICGQVFDEQQNSPWLGLIYYTC